MKSVRFPTLSADVVSRVLRRSVEATADQIVEQCGGGGFDIYKSAWLSSPSVYGTRLSFESLTRGWPDTLSYRMSAGVVREVARVASARDVMCHRLPGRLFRIRPDLAIGLPRSFYFSASGKIHLFDLQPRKTKIPSPRQLGIRSSISLEASQSHPDLMDAEVELVECGPQYVNGPHRGRLFKSQDLEISRGLDLTALLQVYADAWDLLQAKRPEFVLKALTKAVKKAQKPDSQPYWF